MNTNLQTKQKSTIQRNKQLTSDIFGNQQNLADDINISDSEDREGRIGKLLPPSVKQKDRRKYLNPTQYNYNRNNTYIGSMNDNREHNELFWEEQMYNYQDLKGEITENLTNHTNKLIDNIENKFRQINENIERKQEEAIEMVFDKLERTLDNTNRQNNLRSENGNSNNDRNSNNNNIQNTNIPNNRQQENRSRRSNSITIEERETTTKTHTNESLRSLARRIETLVKTAYSLYTEDYRNSLMNQTFIRCLDNELKTAALKKHATHKQTPREPEISFKTLIDKIDQMDLTRTITNNHKRLYEVNQTTTNISEDLKQMKVACNNINDLNQNDLEQFEGIICNVLNGINNTYDKKNFKGRPKFALFCSYCSSHGHTTGRCFKRLRRENIARPKERSFYSHMRNNQNLPNRRIDSNNINGRQLP